MPIVLICSILKYPILILGCCSCEKSGGRVGGCGGVRGGEAGVKREDCGDTVYAASQGAAAAAGKAAGQTGEEPSTGSGMPDVGVGGGCYC